MQPHLRGAKRRGGEGENVLRAVGRGGRKQRHGGRVCLLSLSLTVCVCVCTDTRSLSSLGITRLNSLEDMKQGESTSLSIIFNNHIQITALQTSQTSPLATCLKVEAQFVTITK